MGDRPDSRYSYGHRVIAEMSHRALRLGEGRISGYLSSFLGVMSLLGVLCFRFPEYLTTPELRSVYDVELLRLLLKGTMWVSLVLGSLNLARNKRKRMAAVGVSATALAFAFGGYSIEERPVAHTPLFAGVDWMVLDLLVSAAIFIVIEKLMPKYREQVILRPEWQLDLFYFAINHLLIGVLLLVGNGFAPLVFGWAVNAKLQAFVSSLPLISQLLVLMVCADMVQYWVHRAFHRVPALWRFHAVHHSPEHMDWLAGSRNHIGQILVDRSLVMVPLYLLGPAQSALDLYVVVAAFQAVFVHANVGLPFGPLRYVFVTPQFHHWHHSKDDPAIDTNYAVHLPVIDILFGTFHLPSIHWPKDYGTVKPLPRSFLGQLRYPFRRES